MRKLIYPMNTSLDLYVEGTDGNFAWTTPDDELHKHFNDLIAVATTHLHGRRMWETMGGYWPTAEADPACTPVMKEFARYWNACEHIVFSRSLQSVEHGARLVRDNAVEIVRQLKSGAGSDMLVGGPGLASTLIAAGLVDEIRPYIHPVAVGAGKPFLLDLPGQLDLRLLGSHTFANGVVQLRYAPRTT
ncbi:MAG TPA: dihydrofolate reductase family protein [Candidatus Eremiobacteraceae bacterium]|nr:dihydrofolate reductase family protein [Candidatus Eremiobacteraceae bacterium]